MSAMPDKIGDHMDRQVGAETVKAKAQFEETVKNVNVVIAPSQSEAEKSVAEQQIADDNRLIPNIGDERVMMQKGRIGSPDGETFIENDLRFVRRRNKNGGVDVECHIPALGLANDVST